MEAERAFKKYGYEMMPFGHEKLVLLPGTKTFEVDFYVAHHKTKNYMAFEGKTEQEVYKKFAELELKVHINA